MANPEHVQLVQRVKDWNKWRKDNPDINPNLRGADLSKADLQMAELHDADLWQMAELHDADLWADPAKQCYG
jgi:hypothetical protein